MSEPSATISVDYLNDDDSDQGVTFNCNAWPAERGGPEVETVRRVFNAYDDDGILYYKVVADLSDEPDLGALLNQLGAFAGVTRLEDITGDGEDWSAS